MKTRIVLGIIGLIILLSGLVIGRTITIDKARAHQFSMALNPKTGLWTTCSIGIIAVDIETNTISEVYTRTLYFVRDEGEGPVAPAGIKSRLDQIASELQTYVANKFED